MPTLAQLKEYGQRILSSLPIIKAELSRTGGPEAATTSAMTQLEAVGKQLVADGEHSATITSKLESTAAPIVSSLYPGHGPATGGTIITIKGSGLSHVSSVMFGVAAASDLVLKSDSEISVKSPPGLPTRSVDVYVTTPKGQSPIVPGVAFSYSG